MIRVRILNDNLIQVKAEDEFVKVKVLADVVPIIPRNYGLITYNGYDITVS